VSLSSRGKCRKGKGREFSTKTACFVRREKRFLTSRGGDVALAWAEGKRSPKREKRSRPGSLRGKKMARRKNPPLEKEALRRAIQRESGGIPLASRVKEREHRPGFLIPREKRGKT